MQPAPGSSHDEAIADWKVTVRRMASPLSGYEEADLCAASAIWGNVSFPLTNHAFLERTPDDMEAVTDAVCGFATQRAYAGTRRAERNISSRRTSWRAR